MLVRKKFSTRINGYHEERSRTRHNVRLAIDIDKSSAKGDSGDWFYDSFRAYLDFY